MCKRPVAKWCRKTAEFSRKMFEETSVLLSLTKSLNRFNRGIACDESGIFEYDPDTKSQLRSGSLQTVFD
ncbi:hypothetical protein TNCV_3452401 [Trichonephila clavipes]|nr:hypothetical protein TNCV_3452401 [Trichonephila clavipes]